MLSSAADIKDLLSTSKTLAVVGVSDKPDRPSYGVAKYLLENSHFDIYLVNPAIDEVLGRKVYKTLREIPIHIDIVDVFRKPADCMGVLNESIEISAGAIWLQLGISVEEVGIKAEEAGMKVIMNRCIKIDYAAM